MKYCSECGTQLIEKECGIDGLVPYCPTCKQFRYILQKVKTLKKH